jgi:uncharacterized protein YecE (DUF72 family)
VGTSGYQYSHWRGVFYPNELPTRSWLSCYAGHFDSVEINNTFYRLPSEKTFDVWRESVTDDFCFALKFSRYSSHLKHLKDPGPSIQDFVEHARRLGRHLGPVLVQLPPRWKANPERLSAFLDAVPTECRWALEFREPSWLCEAVYSILRAHGAALCIHDMIEKHPREVTTDWVYLRFHGDVSHGSYSPQALSAQARKIKSYLAAGLDVYAYFNNDAEGHAPRNAAALRRYVLG